MGTTIKVGGRSWTTMTVGEMIAKLQQFDPELPAIASWEGIFVGFEDARFIVEEYEGRKQLTIDVDQ